ncbi:MAG: helix-turn-helix domain-containing protein [Betaproteobacteria bacterium]|nr:helix-turn-helix domain-containing protein [Betaproteobacteria bacterium]
MGFCTKKWQICQFTNSAGLRMIQADTPTVNNAGNIGTVLRIARERAGLSIEAMAKKTGLRSAQVQALEESDSAVFRRNNQEMLWAARLYARKLGLDLPSGIRFVTPTHPKSPGLFSLPNTIPAFLMKPP